MAEEKKQTATEVEAKDKTEEKHDPAKTVVYSYNVKRFENGLYDFDGVILDEKKGVPSIDKLSIARDIIELGGKLDHQLTVEEAEQRVMARLSQLANSESKSDGVVK